METNVLGLPSLTGFTPLKASQEGQVLKYDFKGVGPRVVDKSGNFNGGMLKPLWPVNSPRRKPVAQFPLKAIMNFDGEDDYIDIGQPDSLDYTGETHFSISARVNADNISQEYGDIVNLEEREVGMRIQSGNWNFFFVTRTVTGNKHELTPLEMRMNGFIWWVRTTVRS